MVKLAFIWFLWRGLFILGVLALWFNMVVLLICLTSQSISDGAI